MTNNGKCPGCGQILNNTVGECAIYGSHDIPDLCEPCWLEEDALIDQEGTNDPDHSEPIKQRLEQYRSMMKS